MNTSGQQFKHSSSTRTPPIKPLPVSVRKNYQELAHFVNLQIKQKRLDAATCYPWELDCNPQAVKGLRHQITTRAWAQIRPKDLDSSQNSI